MFTIVIFNEEKGTPVEGVPNQWLKKIGKDTFCYWPNNNTSNYIKKCSQPDPTWKLCKCQVLSKAATYDLMIKQRRESMELTLEQETEHSAVEETSEECDEVIPQFSQSKKSKRVVTDVFFIRY